MTLLRHFRSWPGRLVLAFFDLLPLAKLESAILGLVGRRAASLPPDEALRFLFRLDAAVYPLMGRYAVAYDGGTHTKHRHTRYHDFFVSRVSPGERVLDIGCGNGTLAYDIAKRVETRIVGVDRDPAKITDARERCTHPNLEFHVGDANEGLPPGRFDVVVLSNVLEHLDRRVAVLRHLGERTGASRFLIRVPLFERDWRVPLKRELGVEWRLDPTHETEYTLESFAREMAESGLVPVHQEVRWGEIWAELVAG